MNDNLSVIYFGMPIGGELSRRPLAALLDAGIYVCAIVVPGLDADSDPISLDPPELDLPDFDFVPMVSQHIAPGPITIAWERHIPLLSIGRFGASALETLAAFQPDVICVSCFSRIIPPAILNLPKFGALNLHPSLLPRYRGPMPLFWQFRNGEARTGATLHFMSERVDAGDILLQTEVEFPDGIGGAEAEELCAEAGGRLMVEGLNLIRGGAPPRHLQKEADSTYHPLPTRADFAIPTAWPARRAYNFVHGVDSLGENLPFEITAGGETFHVADATEFSADGVLGAPYRREGGDVLIQFNPGVLRIVT